MPASQTSTVDRAGHRGWSLLRFKDPTLPLWIGAVVLLFLYGMVKGKAGGSV